MTKSDLRTGMVITLRNGRKHTVYLNCQYNYFQQHHNVIVNQELKSWFSLDEYNEDLTSVHNESYDIVEVELVDHPYDFNTSADNANTVKTLWERKEAKKMTVAEIEAILGHKVEIISDD